MSHSGTRNTHYRGRFAPSPTGPLHLGSLIAALASFLDARYAGGDWLLRIEDLDPPREEAGAAERILHSLHCHGLVPDEPVLWQSTRTGVYHDALRRLAATGLLFRCDCSRSVTGADGRCAADCRSRPDRVGTPAALRIAIPPDCDIIWTDGIQGAQRTPLGRQTGDFVVQRKDGLIAYQLAVVVDDAAQGISCVVRGSDLLDSTPRQRYLQQLLGYPHPDYRHLPVITTRQGQKFSKQNLAPALDDTQPLANLRLALRFLAQPEPPTDIDTAASLLSHAAAHWDLARVPAVLALPATRLGLDT